MAVCHESQLGKGETILLVEDDAQLLCLTCSLLEDLGYHVLTASNGVDALEVEDDYENDIPLLLSDVVMPALGGFDLAQIIRERRPAMKALFMSGYAKPSHTSADNLPQSSQFLQKPFKPEILAQHLRNELDTQPMGLIG